MIRLYTANILENISERHMDLIQNNFSEAIIARINKGISEKYRLRQITTRLMLIEIFELMNIDSKELKTIFYNENGKLIIPNIDYHISISYCENKAICGVSNSIIGVDIEDLRERVLSKNKALLGSFIRRKINSSLDFYKNWTRIESISKTYQKGGLNNLFTDRNFFNRVSKTTYLLMEDYFLIAVSTI